MLRNCASKLGRDRTETMCMATVMPVAGSSPLEMDFEFCSFCRNSPTSSCTILLSFQDGDSRLRPLDAFSSGVVGKVESDSLSRSDDRVGSVFRSCRDELYFSQLTNIAELETTCPVFAVFLLKRRVPSLSSKFIPFLTQPFM
jgi:hypothetical protein